MPSYTRMKRTFLHGLLWFHLVGFGFMALSLEPGFLDFDNLPDTNFTCVGKVIGGYYADLETNCQMFHVCTIGQLDEPMDIRFLCLNGTVFDQETRVCERIDEVDCAKSERFYSLNLELYGNTQPAISEDSSDNQETEQPLIIKSTTTPSTTTTTTKRPAVKPTPPPAFFTSSSAPQATTPDRQAIAHHFPSVVNANSPSDIRFNPEEINISLNPGAPPNIRSKPVSYHSQTYSDSNSNNKIVVTTHSTVYNDDKNVQMLANQGLDRPQGSTTHSPKPRLPPTQTDITFDFTFPEQEFHTEVPQQYHFPASGFHHSQSFPARISHQFQSTTHKGNYQNSGATTVRNVYHHTLKPVQVQQQQQHYYQRTEKPPQRLQLPLPLLPTLPPLTFSSPAPFSLQRHIETKRYTKDHQAPPRIIISASASVSDASGRRLNYSLGTIGAGEIVQTPTGYEEYKEEDVGLDPFYHDVPKLKQRSKRSTMDKINPFEIIKNEDEALDVLKFLFHWYQSHQATVTASPVTIPVSSELITNINHELAPQASDEGTTEALKPASDPEGLEQKKVNITDSPMVKHAVKLKIKEKTNQNEGYVNVDDYVNDNYEPQTYEKEKEIDESRAKEKLLYLTPSTSTAVTPILEKAKEEDSIIYTQINVLTEVNDDAPDVPPSTPKTRKNGRKRGRLKSSRRIEENKENLSSSLKNLDTTQKTASSEEVLSIATTITESSEPKRKSRRRGRLKFVDVEAVDQLKVNDLPTRRRGRIKSTTERIHGLYVVDADYDNKKDQERNVDTEVNSTEKTSRNNTIIKEQKSDTFTETSLPNAIEMLKQITTEQNIVRDHIESTNIQEKHSNDAKKIVDDKEGTTPSVISEIEQNSAETSSSEEILNPPISKQTTDSVINDYTEKNKDQEQSNTVKHDYQRYTKVVISNTTPELIIIEVPSEKHNNTSTKINTDDSDEILNLAENNSSIELTTRKVIIEDDKIIEHHTNPSEENDTEQITSPVIANRKVTERVDYIESKFPPIAAAEDLESDKSQFTTTLNPTMRQIEDNHGTAPTIGVPNVEHVTNENSSSDIDDVEISATPLVVNSTDNYEKTERSLIDREHELFITESERRTEHESYVPSEITHAVSEHEKSILKPKLENEQSQYSEISPEYAQSTSSEKSQLKSENEKSKIYEMPQIKSDYDHTASPGILNPNSEDEEYKVSTTTKSEHDQSMFSELPQTKPEYDHTTSSETLYTRDEHDKRTSGVPHIKTQHDQLTFPEIPQRTSDYNHTTSSETLYPNSEHEKSTSEIPQIKSTDDQSAFSEIPRTKSEFDHTTFSEEQQINSTNSHPTFSEIPRTKSDHDQSTSSEILHTATPASESSSLVTSDVSYDTTLESSSRSTVGNSRNSRRRSHSRGSSRNHIDNNDKQSTQRRRNRQRSRSRTRSENPANSHTNSFTNIAHTHEAHISYPVPHTSYQTAVDTEKNIVREVIEDQKNTSEKEVLNIPDTKVLQTYKPYDLLKNMKSISSVPETTTENYLVTTTTMPVKVAMNNAEIFEEPLHQNFTTVIPFDYDTTTPVLDIIPIYYRQRNENYINSTQDRTLATTEAVQETYLPYKNTSHQEKYHENNTVKSEPLSKVTETITEETVPREHIFIKPEDKIKLLNNLVYINQKLASEVPIVDTTQTTPISNLQADIIDTTPIPVTNSITFSIAITYSSSTTDFTEINQSDDTTKASQVTHSSDFTGASASSDLQQNTWSSKFTSYVTESTAPVNEHSSTESKKIGIFTSSPLELRNNLRSYSSSSTTEYDPYKIELFTSAPLVEQSIHSTSLQPQKQATTSQYSRDGQAEQDTIIDDLKDIEKTQPNSQTEKSTFSEVLQRKSEYENSASVTEATISISIEPTTIGDTFKSSEATKTYSLSTPESIDHSLEHDIEKYNVPKIPKSTLQDIETTTKPTTYTSSSVPKVENLEKFIQQVEVTTGSIVTTKTTPDLESVTKSSDASSTDSTGVNEATIISTTLENDHFGTVDPTTTSNQDASTEHASTSTTKTPRRRTRPSRRRTTSRQNLGSRHRSNSEAEDSRQRAKHGRERGHEDVLEKRVDNVNKERNTDAPLYRSANPTQSETRKQPLSTTPLSRRKSDKFFFNCFGKEINKFYPDPRDCRLFHYCTRGYSKNQLLDMKFVCDLKTYFDEEKLICTKVKPKRCV